MSKEIKICESHQYYETPLIWTYAFMGAEYWCPHCGNTSGMLGAGIEITETKELTKRHQAFIKYSSDYLHACGLSYASETMWKGKRIKPNKLPKYEIEKNRKIIEDWQHNIKIEEV